jgi:hypothetical protein
LASTTATLTNVFDLEGKKRTWMQGADNFLIPDYTFFDFFILFHTILFFCIPHTSIFATRLASLNSRKRVCGLSVDSFSHAHLTKGSGPTTRCVGAGSLTSTVWAHFVRYLAPIPTRIHPSQNTKGGWTVMGVVSKKLFTTPCWRDNQWGKANFDF